MTKLSKEEKETLVRWDESTSEATVYTASPRMFKKLTKKGWKLAELSPHSWEGKGPVAGVTFRKVKDGAIIKKKRKVIPAAPAPVVSDAPTVSGSGETPPVV